MSAPRPDDAQLRNGGAGRTRVFYCAAVISCLAIITAGWGNSERAHEIMGFAAVMAFQFWNYLKTDATHATATASTQEARQAAAEARLAAKAAADAVVATAANFAAIKKAERAVTTEIHAADEKAERRASGGGDVG